MADRVIMAGVYQQERIAENERLHPEDVVRHLNEAGTPAELHANVNAIVESMVPQVQRGTWLPSCRMAGSTVFMRNCPRA